MDSGARWRTRTHAILTCAFCCFCSGHHSGCRAPAGRRRTWSCWTSPFRPSAFRSWKASSPRSGHHLRLAHLSQRPWLSTRAGRARFTPTRRRSPTSPPVVWRRYVDDVLVGHAFLGCPCVSACEALLLDGRMVFARVPGAESCGLTVARLGGFFLFARFPCGSRCWLCYAVFLLVQKTTSASDATISVEDVSTFNKRTDMHVVRILMQPLPSFRLCFPMRLARVLLLVDLLGKPVWVGSLTPDLSIVSLRHVCCSFLPRLS